MAMRPVEFPPSGNIADIAWDDETMTLTVMFRSNYVYEYYQVDEHMAEGFARAVSASNYLKAFIAGSYPSLRVR